MNSLYWELAILSILVLVAFTSDLNVSIKSIFDENFIFLSLEFYLLLRRIFCCAPGIVGVDITFCSTNSVFSMYGFTSTIEDLLISLYWLCLGTGRILLPVGGWARSDLVGAGVLEITETTGLNEFKCALGMEFGVTFNAEPLGVNGWGNLYEFVWDEAEDGFSWPLYRIQAL